MSTTGKKEYTLRINGVKQSITDVTSLDKALQGLDTTVNKVNATESKGAATKKQTVKALTDEEKAAKKLADTRKRLEQVNGEANKAQIQANIELRERTREVTRQVALDALAEGSVKALGMSLTDLRNSYLELSEAERQDVTIGGEMLTQIQAMDKRYKSLKESTGLFQDSVGDYEKANKGLGRLRGGLDDVGASAMGLAASAGTGSQTLLFFGGAASEASEQLQKLQLITVIMSQVTAAYNAVAKEGIVQENIRKVTDSVRIVQIRAKAAAEAQATRGTIAATIAQRIFNAVANANPYVLLAVLLIGVASALYAFSKDAQTATEKQDALNQSTKAFLDRLELYSAYQVQASEGRIKALNDELKLAQARDASLKETRKIEDKINGERRDANNYQKGVYAQEIKDLEKNRYELLKLETQLLSLNEQKEKLGEDFEDIEATVTINGKDIEGSADKILETLQAAVDNTKRKITVATDINNDTNDIAASDKLVNAQRLAEDKKLAKERADIERTAIRASEDARLKTLQDTYAQSRKSIILNNKRDIEDLKLRLIEEKNLTQKAREAINANIASLHTQLNIDLLKLDEERAAQELEITRQNEDSQNALLVGELEQRRTAIETGYKREVEDLQTKLRLDKSLTAKSRADINAEIINAEKRRNKEIEKLTVEDLQKRTDLELDEVEFRLDKVINKLDNPVIRSKTGLKLIDVDTTRANLSAANSAYDEYIAGLIKYAAKAKLTSEDTIATLKEGTVEYEAERLKYAKIEDAVTVKIKAAQKTQQQNAKESKEIQVQYYAEMFAEIGKYAQGFADTLSTVFNTISMAIQFQIDDLNTKLEATGEYYEEAQARSESAADNVEKLEEQIQNSTGGTTEALKEQLAESMRTRNEALREERRLAKEKEKLEREIQRKERQQRKLELGVQIAMAIANTAQGVSKALSDWMFPLNLVIAGIVGAAGIVQVGLMTKQLSKLADGGEIVGPSHANGGVPLSGPAGSNYEAEGGEFMINKVSYAANRGLVQAINDSSGPISPLELFGAANAAPAIDTRTASSEDRIVNAIRNIVIEPKVSVAEIEDVRNNMVRVQELAGFKN